MDFLKSLKAASSSAFLPAVVSSNRTSPTLEADRITGINPFGITGFRLEAFPEENPRLLREGYKNNHIVFTIADWKAQRMAEATPILYRIKNRKEYARYQAYLKNDKYFEALVTRFKALDEIDEHPILKMFTRPNERQTWSEFCYSVSIYHDFGNALIWGQRLSAGANKGQIRQLYPLPPHTFIGENPTVAGYSSYQNLNDPQKPLAGADVLHLRRFNAEQGYMGGTLWGMSKLTPARRLLAKSAASTEAQAELMQNRGGRWIIFPKASQFNDETDLRPGVLNGGAEATEAIRKKLRQVGSGGVAGNAFELGGIDLSMSAVDMEVIASDRVTKEDFCALWHVQSLAIFSATEGTFANADAAIKASLQMGVLPDQRLLAQKLTNWLRPEYGDDILIEFDTDVYPELQPDKKDIAAWADSVPLTGDERRQLYKWDATGKPEMQVELVKNNLQPVTDFLAAPADGPLKNDDSYTD